MGLPGLHGNGKARRRSAVIGGTVRVFRQKFILEDAIGSHACSLEANMRVTNGIPLGCLRFLPVDAVNCVQTLKVLGSQGKQQRFDDSNTLATVGFQLSKSV
jgi:hypothetical protein